METLVIIDFSALRGVRSARRAYGSLPWGAVGRVEQRHAIEGCVPNADMVDLDDLARLGMWAPNESEELHVLVASAGARRARAPMLCHVCPGPLPLGAIMRVAPGVYCSSPAYTALRCSRGRSVPEILILLLELLGSYSLPPEATFPIAWGGVWPDEVERKSVEQIHYPSEPVVTIKELQAMARYAKSSEYANFRTAVRLAATGSRSPAESIMYGMFAPPLRFGAFGISSLKGGMLLNHRIDFDTTSLHMASGVPYAVCDAYIPAAHIDTEYNGIGHEEENRRIHDGQRNNGLKGMGVTVLVINRDQMRDIVALEAIARSIHKAAGGLLRYRYSGVRQRQTAWLNGLRAGSGLPPA